MFKVVWVAGMPRTGSMWTYNVARELLRRAGFRVMPEEVKLFDQDCIDYVNNGLIASSDPGTVFILKIHAPLSNLPPDHLVITNIRDVRDVVMSYQRFMRVDFEKSLEACQLSLNTVNYYLAFPEAQCLTIRYDELTARPAKTVAYIADRLASGCNDDEADEIAAMFSKKKVRALTESKDRQYQRSLEGEKLPNGEILLSRPDGGVATIDRVTGFQSNHVSDYQDGDWRHSLSAEQIGAMEDAFGDWLEEHSYAA